VNGPLLGPDTVSWRVDREPVVFMGGGRALLMQVAHPLVAAGVAQHSDYQIHPWRRLTRTLDTTIKIVFADPQTSARAASRLAARHKSVRGVADDGNPYDANDPSLLLWVWATLVDTSLTLYERCLGALDPDDRERFYQEQKLFAYACGVPHGACPGSSTNFSDYVDQAIVGELRVTDHALAVRDAIAGGAVAAPLRPLLAPHTLVTAGLLPPRLREAYGFGWGPREQRRLDTWLALVRGGVRVVPRRVRELPVGVVAAGGRSRLSRRGVRDDSRALSKSRPQLRRKG
jgi:uncharacterized protein (DUF2236 family)